MRKSIASICKAYEAEEHFSGAVRVKKGSEVIFEHAYGYAHRGFQIPNELDTKFDTASITKVFTAVAILRLIDEKLLRFDDRIHDLIDLDESSIHKDITVYHLLTHTSGMADDADEEAGEDYALLWKDKPNYAVQDTSDYLPQFMYKEPIFAPGEGCRYNNCAYILLGLVIEKVTGKTYRAYVQESIFERVGMKHTGFYGMDDIVENAAEHYGSTVDEYLTIIDLKKNIYSYPSIGSADAGALSTVGDLDVFMRALKDGKILSPEMTEAILTPKETHKVHGLVTEKMGYGFQFVTKNETDEILYIQKDGINMGVSCIMNYYPTKDVTIIILANQDTDVWELAWEIQEMMKLGYDYV